MKGKRVFTKEEADKIIRLIRQKNRAESSDQKVIRDKIRKHGFYASDFGLHNYNEHDFLRVTTIRAEATPSSSTKSIDNITAAIDKSEPKSASRQSEKNNASHEESPLSDKPDKKERAISDSHTEFHVKGDYSGTKEWRFTQVQSSLILASGLQKLSNAPNISDLYDVPMTYGNYLISSNRLKYIGESNDLRSRIKQQTVERTSSFFKNYLKWCKINLSISENLSISDFDISYIPTSIGRKELEEFGIVHLPANLNKFQLGKRKKYEGEVDEGLWDDVQSNASQLLEEAEKLIIQLEPAPWFQADVLDCAGLYWVDNKSDGLIYIGETSGLKKRWKVHSSKTYFSALRRHIGENILGFELKVKDGKKRYFSKSEDSGVDWYLEQCAVKMLPVSFGRFELEEYLIREYRPLLNRKENK